MVTRLISRRLLRVAATLGVALATGFGAGPPAEAQAEAQAQAQAKAKEFSFTLVGQSMIRTDVRATSPEAVPVIKSLLKGDAAFTNFEATVYDLSKGQSPKEGRFSTPPEAMDALKSFGFNLLSFANNHAFDLKAVGISNNIARAEQLKLTHAGTGQNISEAGAPAYLRTPRGTVALVAIASGEIVPEARATATQAGVNELRIEGDKPNTEDAQRILQTIREAKKHADYVVVSQHQHAYGPIPFRTIMIEQLPLRLHPAKWVPAWTRAEIDAGADVVSMHGSPFLQGVEIYKDRPIFYDLGNFIFQPPPASIWLDEPIQYESVVAYVDFKGGKLQSVKFRPIVQNKIGQGQPDMHDQTTVNLYLQTRGLPKPAGQEAPFILERLVAESRPYGTEILVKGDSAEVRLKGGRPR